MVVVVGHAQWLRRQWPRRMVEVGRREVMRGHVWRRVVHRVWWQVWRGQLMAWRGRMPPSLCPPLPAVPARLLWRCRRWQVMRVGLMRVHWHVVLVGRWGWRACRVGWHQRLLLLGVGRQLQGRRVLARRVHTTHAAAAAVSERQAVDDAGHVRI